MNILNQLLIGVKEKNKKWLVKELFMELKEIISNYENCTDEKRGYVLLTMLINKAEELKTCIKPELEKGDVGTEVFEDLGYSFCISEINKSTLDSVVKKEMTEDEIAFLYKPTEKDLKAIGRIDLINKFKSIQKVKQIKVSKFA